MQGYKRDFAHFTKSLTAECRGRDTSLMWILNLDSWSLAIGHLMITSCHWSQ